MVHVFDSLIREYGVIAVFIGCLAEGESVAILGGFFAHQALLPLLFTYLAAFAGAFIGDTAFYVIGRHFAQYHWVRKLKAKPGFSHAMRLARRHEALFVFFNRYAYGMRIAGGVACGVARIPWPVFVTFNMLSAMVWAALFVSVGYFFGLGVETLIGSVLHAHQRLVIGAGIVIAVTVVVVIITQYVKRRESRAVIFAPPKD